MIYHLFFVNKEEKIIVINHNKLQKKLMFYLDIIDILVIYILLEKNLKYKEDFQNHYFQQSSIILMNFFEYLLLEFYY